MRKLNILFVLLLFCSSVAFAQDDIKAQQFSRFMYQGTARSTAMGGAFTSLGGDFSAVVLNPASIGVYSSSAFSITTSVGSYGSEATYFSNTVEDNRINVKIDELSAVFNFDLMNTDSRFLHFNLGLGYTKLADFNSNLRIRGVNYDNSIMNYFENNANEGIYHQAYEGLAESAGLIIYDEENEFFFSEVVDDQILYPDQYHVTQLKTVEERGNMGAFNVSFGLNYSNKFYMGGAINIISLYHKQEQEHSEFDPVDYDILGFHSMSFKEYSIVEGLGLNVHLGGIYVPTPMIRLGFSIQTPTFMEVNEEWYNGISSSFDNGQGTDGDIESGTYTNDYKFSSPWRIQSGIALQLSGNGYLSFGHEYVNYQNSKFRDLPTDVEIYDDPNGMIDTYLHAAHNLSAGIEWRFNPIYVRAGYAFYADPHDEFDLNFDSKNDVNVISGGLGARMGDMGIDISASYSEQPEKQYNLYVDNPVNAKYTQSKFRFAVTFSTRF
ncbi:MAG: OmpP1/FadL family transporter [Bacteroidota bacterium]